MGSPVEGFVDHTYSGAWLPDVWFLTGLNIASGPALRVKSVLLTAARLMRGGGRAAELLFGNCGGRRMGREKAEFPLYLLRPAGRARPVGRRLAGLCGRRGGFVSFGGRWEGTCTVLLGLAPRAA